MTDEEKREKLARHKRFVSECNTPGGCRICKRIRVDIDRLESELGTVAPEHRAKSSGALKR